jgi:hypothetical protein
MKLRRMERLTMAASVGQAGWALLRQWQALPEKRRTRIQGLLRKSGGRPSNLSGAERRELKDLVSELNLGQVARDAIRTSSRGRSRRG